jgi:hypothetical protein
MRPFYKLSSGAVHGGSQGFFRLGLNDEYQDKVLLVGPSIFGLADPLQNTAISLNQVTCSILGLKTDYENIILAKVIDSYVKQILSEVLKVHNAMKK